MQIYLIEEDKNSATIGLKDANLTLINPLIKVLNDNPDVALVRLIDSHPELNDRRLFVDMRKGKALTAVKKAAEQLSKYYS